MTSRQTQENVIALLVLAIFIAAIVASLGYGPRARLVPIPIASLGVVLMVAQIVLQNMRAGQNLEIDLLEFISKKATGDDEDLPDAAPQTETTVPARAAPIMSELTVLGIVFLLTALFLIIGPIPAMFVFTTGYFGLSGYFSPIRAILYAFIITFLVYAMFHLWLRVDLDQGYFSFGLF